MDEEAAVRGVDEDRLEGGETAVLLEDRGRRGGEDVRYRRGVGESKEVERGCEDDERGSGLVLRRVRVSGQDSAGGKVDSTGTNRRK